MNSEPNKQCCNRADEVKKESQSCNKDDELAQLLANLEITDSALYLSNERIEEIASTDSDAEKACRSPTEFAAIQRQHLCSSRPQF